MAKRAYARVTIKRHYKDFTGADLKNFSDGVKSKINGNPLIPVPIIALLTFQTHIDTLQSVLTARVTDTSPTLERDQQQAETVLWDDLDAYADQVILLANAATPGDTATIEAAILNIGFQIRGTGGKQDQIFEVIDVDHGQAKITMPLPEDKNKRVIYVLSATLTPADDNSWSAPVFAIESRVTLADLTADKRWHFRFAVILPQGLNPVIHLNDPQIVWESTIISALIP